MNIINDKIFGSIHNLFYYIKMFFRIMHIFYVLISEISEFTCTNLLRKFVYKLPLHNRLELLKKVTTKLEDLNIVYVKIFQSLCINKFLLSDDEKKYLIKYTDNVPFTSDDIDYEILDTLEKEHNIHLDAYEPINSGIVSVVFKGIYGNNSDKIVIKVLKNNINERLIEVFNELQLLVKIFQFIPYINNLNLDKLLEDNKELLLNQTDFNNEVKNIMLFKEKNKNINEFKIPYVYNYITSDHSNVIVMENIKGMVYSEVESLDPDIKNEFGKLMIKFGYINVLYNNAIHCDLHVGNIFFYINTNNLLPKYQIGIIDFGIVSFPSKETQHVYYKFFNTIKLKKDYENIFGNIVQYLIEPKNIVDKLSKEQIQELDKYIKYGIHTYVKNNEIAELIYNITFILNKYKLVFIKDFNQCILSLQSSYILGRILCIDMQLEEEQIFRELNKVNELIEIP